MGTTRIIVQKDDMAWLCEKCRDVARYRGYSWGTIVNWMYCLTFAINDPSWEMGFVVAVATVCMVYFIAMHAKFFFECSNGFSEILESIELHDNREKN